MSDTPKTEPAADDPEALRQDIVEKRRELGDTAAELAAKADVKSQVRDKVDESKEAVATQASRLDPRLLGAVAVIVLLLLVLRRRRR